MSTGSSYRLKLLCVALLLSLFALTAREVQADTDVTVNDARDLPDPSPNLGPDCASTAGTCTLRAAIQRANHQIGTHTIRLPAGTFGITRTGRNENDAETGDFDIKGNIVVIGAGAKATRINGFGNDRVFDVRSGSLALHSLTVTNGHAINEDGGGIRATAPLTLNRVHLHSNFTQRDGGGIATNSDLSVVRSTISDNQAAQAAGAIDASFIGLFQKRGISIRESTISGNTDNAGAIIIGTDYDITILHSTIAFNDPVGLKYIVRSNLTINHTILANNALFNCFAPTVVFGTTTSIASNVDSDTSCEFTSVGGNLNSVDPQLSALADNGGQTPTHLFNNPILQDEGDAAGSSCSGIDQRGFPRPVDFDGDGIARCDIGAIELQGPVGVAVLDPEMATVRKDRPFHLSYLWRVPPQQNWRDLTTLDLRVVERDNNDKGPSHGHDDEVIFWVRWSEATDTFQLVDPDTGRPRGRAVAAGSNHVLKTKDVALDVKHSSSEGSGPTGQEVTLHLALTFHEKSKKNEPFTIEVTAVDDHGQTQPFLALGSVAVGPPKGH